MRRRSFERSSALAISTRGPRGNRGDRLAELALGIAPQGIDLHPASAR